MAPGMPSGVRGGPPPFWTFAPRGRCSLGIVLFVLLLLCAARPAWTCTLWSASGEAAGGGSLLVKNRDYVPRSTGKLLLVRPDKGLAYLGLFARVRGNMRLVAGINEAGLAMVSATAGSVPRAERRKPSLAKALMARTLANASSVEEALARAHFSGHTPVIYMLADRLGSAWVEVGPGGAVAVRRAAQGVLAHTNHYVSQELSGMNSHVGKSSAARLERIAALLKPGGPFSMEDFERFGNDRSAGPDDSIMRDGSAPGATRTMARFLVRIPASGSPVAWVTGFDDPKRPWVRRLVLDAALWKSVGPGETMVLATPE